jgi:hypothetical protein
MLVPEGTTVGELAAKVHPDLEKHFLFAESVDGMRLGEEHVLTPQTSIMFRISNLPLFVFLFCSFLPSFLFDTLFFS